LLTDENSPDDEEETMQLNVTFPRLLLSTAALAGLSMTGAAQLVCDAGGPYTFEATGQVTAVVLDGSGSTGNIAEYRWLAECAFVQPSFIPNFAFGVNPTFLFDLEGSCSRTCLIQLRIAEPPPSTTTAQCTTLVTVHDTTPPDISCPPDLNLVYGDPTDPGNTGFATATDLVDSDPDVTFNDVIIPQCEGTWVGNVCNGTLNPFEQRIIRTWTATDYCLNFSTCVQTITLLSPGNPPRATFDFNVKACPNGFTPVTTGSVDVALLSTPLFIASKRVVPASIQISRTNVPGSLKPASISILDVGTAVAANWGECNSAALDGLPDLRLRFSKAAMVQTLGLGSIKPGTPVDVLLTGITKDGKPWAQRDVIVIQ
jgi:hypothetical protein